MSTDAAKLKHLEFIQGTINRLSTNSFLLKGWTVLIVTALLSFAVLQNSVGMGVFTSVPLLVFWGLDGYFLWEERKYRKHYDRVRQSNSEKIDFSMDVSDLTSQVGGWLRAVFSKTLIAFHGIILISILAAIANELGAMSWLRGCFLAFTTEMTTGEPVR